MLEKGRRLMGIGLDLKKTNCMDLKKTNCIPSAMNICGVGDLHQLSATKKGILIKSRLREREIKEIREESHVICVKSNLEDLKLLPYVYVQSNRPALPSTIQNHQPAARHGTKTGLQQLT